MRVDEDVVKHDAFAFERLEDEVVNRPEGIFGEGVCSEPVLVAHHDEFKVQFFADKSEITEHSLDKLQLLEAVDLLVGRLLDERTVTVYKQ